MINGAETGVLGEIEGSEKISRRLEFGTVRAFLFFVYHSFITFITFSPPSLMLTYTSDDTHRLTPRRKSLRL